MLICHESGTVGLDTVWSNLDTYEGSFGRAMALVGLGLVCLLGWRKNKPKPDPAADHP